MVNLETTINQSKIKRTLNIAKNLYQKSTDHLNYKWGIRFGIIGGSIVYYINKDHGFQEAFDKIQEAFDKKSKK